MNNDLLEKLRNSNFAENLKYPLKYYLKENGYLGITGYNDELQKPFIASKSTDDGEFSEWFEILLKNALKNKFNTFFNELRDKNLSAVFEVIDVENDPHIVKYKESKVVLLDLIYREQDFRKTSDKDRISFAKRYNLETKKLYGTIYNKEEFDKFVESMKSLDKEIEGFVVEDSNGYMFKIKIGYYNFWKKIRSIKESMKKGKEVKGNTEMEQSVIDFLKVNPNLLREDVITIREQFNKIS